MAADRNHSPLGSLASRPSASMTITFRTTIGGYKKIGNPVRQAGKKLTNINKQSSYKGFFPSSVMYVRDVS